MLENSALSQIDVYKHSESLSRPFLPPHSNALHCRTCKINQQTSLAIHLIQVVNLHSQPAHHAVRTYCIQEEWSSHPWALSIRSRGAVDHGQAFRWRPPPLRCRFDAHVIERLQDEEVVVNSGAKKHAKEPFKMSFPVVDPSPCCQQWIVLVV